MWVVSDDDKYVASTWGATVHLTAGQPKQVGQDLGLLCLQEGCTEVKGEVAPATTAEEVVETTDEVVEVEVTTPNLDGMTKVQLEEHGRTLGIELDRRKKKADLIEEIKAAE